MIRISTGLLLLALALLPIGCGGAPGASGGSTPAPAATPIPASPVNVDKPVDLQIFVMAQCPFGKGAEGVLHKVMQTVPGAIKLDLGFVIAQSGDGFRSLHGPEEVALNKVQACAGLLAPDLQLAFIDRDNTTPEDWQAAASEVGLDPAKIEECVAAGRADEILVRDARRNKEMGVTASPTIFINGKEYTGTISSLDLFAAVCNELGDQRPAVCNNPPEHLSRSDGATAGRCGGEDDAPKVDPSMVDEMSFQHTVIIPSKAFTDNSDKILAQTKALFPKIDIVQISDQDPKAKKLIQEYKLEWLPAFIFPKTIENARTFERLKAVLVPVGEPAQAYQLDPMKIGSNYSLKRTETPKQIKIFYTPFSPQVLTLLMDIVDVLSTEPHVADRSLVQFLPSARVDLKGKLLAPRGLAELEEIERHSAILQLAPLQFRDYIAARRDNPNGTYWEDFVTKAGMDPKQIKESARSDKTKELLAASSQEATDLGIGTEIAFLVNNREVAQVQDKEEFKRLLAYVKNLK